MPGHVPGIHVFGSLKRGKTWMAGTSPAMTNFMPLLVPEVPGVREHHSDAVVIRGFNHLIVAH
jgi:hypothetical protein